MSRVRSGTGSGSRRRAKEPPETADARLTCAPAPMCDGLVPRGSRTGRDAAHARDTAGTGGIGRFVDRDAAHARDTGPAGGPRDGETTVTSTAGGAFGFTSGLIIQEFGYDDDVDQALRKAAEAQTGTALVDEDYEDVADSAIVWWRADDGDVDDLTDLLVDAQANLDGDGLVWVLTPKARTAGAVPPADVEEAARTAGMHATSAAAMGRRWSGIRVSSRRH